MDVHDEFVQCRGGQTHAPWWETVPQHALDVRGRWSLLVVRQSAKHRRGVATVLRCRLVGQNCPGRVASGV